MLLQPVSFEEVLVSHAAPVLAGIKPSALLSFPRKQYPALPALVKRFARLLGGKGVALEIVCRCERHRLLFVYRPSLLRERLREPEVRACLCRFGYPGGGFSPVMRRLRSRLREGNGFPHEVGLFLGYPPRDVLAFLGELPAPCRLCGYWKVYFDEENARRVFALYDRCRAVYREAYRSGRSVPELMELPVSG